MNTRTTIILINVVALIVTAASVCIPLWGYPVPVIGRAFAGLARDPVAILIAVGIVAAEVALACVLRSGRRATAATGALDSALNV